MHAGRTSSVSIPMLSATSLTSDEMGHQLWSHADAVEADGPDDRRLLDAEDSTGSSKETSRQSRTLLSQDERPFQIGEYQ